MDGAAFKHRLIARLQPLARKVPGGMSLGRVLYRWIDPERRAIHALRQRDDITLFQPFPTTAEDRYPELFDALALRLAGLPQPRILSFGCANGAEVRALRRRIPDARITGIDINPHALKHARQSDLDPRSSYRCADRPPPGERFDAILALAVFRHGMIEENRPQDCAAILPFNRVAEGIARLDAALEPGGWLAICNAHYRFCDFAASSGYSADPLQFGQPQSLLYGPDNKRLADATYADVLFHKDR